MPAFALRRPDLAIERVEVVTALSDGAREKGLDVATVCLTICGEAVLVDLMPTIGSEEYDSSGRVPTRDSRGTASQDALRRDLTIGAMLVHVTRPERPYVADARAVAVATDAGGFSVAGLAATDTNSKRKVGRAAAAAAADLVFTLLDHHGGIEDVYSRLIRAPYPAEQSAADVWEQAMSSTRDRERARDFGLEPCSSDETEEERMKLQALWWIKALREDPLRVIRALRFTASLGFRLHASFGTAASIALDGVAWDKISSTRAPSRFDRLLRACTSIPLRPRGSRVSLLKLHSATHLPHRQTGGAAQGCEGRAPQTDRLF